MNENIDLTKILKDCPIGTEFYHAVYGRVWLYGIDLNRNYPIQVSFSKEMYYDASVTSKGLFSKNHNGECVLFPSKEQRDWSKFTAPWYKKKKFDPKTLKPFDKVLAKIGTESYYTWFPTFISLTPNNIDDTIACIGKYGDVTMAIPYNEETQHLVGTTDEAPEYYRYWED